MSDNPFQSPSQLDFRQASPGPGGVGPKSQVEQVNLLGIFSIIQGVLVLVYALFIVMYGFFFQQMDQFMPAEQAKEFREQFKEVSSIVMLGVVILGGGFGLMGIGYIVAGIQAIRLKWRIFNMVVLLAGIASSISCYCAPTAIGLTIFGLIVLLKPAVIQAFEMRKTGMSKPDVLNQFY